MFQKVQNLKITWIDGTIPAQERSLFYLLSQCLLPFMLHAEIQRQMHVTSQRRSVFLLSQAHASFHSKDAGREGNQKLTHWGPQTLRCRG